MRFQARQGGQQGVGRGGKIARDKMSHLDNASVMNGGSSVPNQSLYSMTTTPQPYGGYIQPMYPPLDTCGQPLAGHFSMPLMYYPVPPPPLPPPPPPPSAPPSS